MGVAVYLHIMSNEMRTEFVLYIFSKIKVAQINFYIGQ